jgi:uncharacterized repeat protein (TIGR03847 family)
VAIELDPVDRITTDAVGPAGERTFFIQARKDEQVVTVLAEKQQVQLLAASILEILARVDEPIGEVDPEAVMSLEEPVIPEWRAGRLSIGYQEDRDLILLEIEELIPGQEDEEDEDAGALEPPGEVAEEAREPASVRFWATRQQMLAMARHGAEVCAAGRPICQFCENPIDPEGHTCPAMNGHRDLGES